MVSTAVLVIAAAVILFFISRSQTGGDGGTQGAPTADFSFSPSSPSPGETISFDGTLSSDPDGSIIGYSWDFGDGTTGTGSSPTHSYSSAGDYIVTLTVTDDGGLTDSITSTLTVSDTISLNADFSYSPSDPTQAENIQFDGTLSSDPDGTIQTWEWDFGDGTTGTGSTVTHDYLDFGDYTVTLTVTDDAGNTDSISVTVTVFSEPTASFEYTPTDPIVGEQITFEGGFSTDLDGSIVAYDWDFGDGTTGTGETTTHTYTAQDNYVVRLTVTDDDGFTNWQEREITVLSSQLSPSRQKPLRSSR